MYNGAEAEYGDKYDDEDSKHKRQMYEVGQKSMWQ